MSMLEAMGASLQGLGWREERIGAQVLIATLISLSPSLPLSLPPSLSPSLPLSLPFPHRLAENKSLYTSTSFHPTPAPFSPCWQSSSRTTPLRAPPNSTASPHCASTSPSPSLRPGVLDRYVFRASERGNTSTSSGTPCDCEWFGRTLQALGTALG
ncbi:BQ5605_C008g04972 [Microbotryum silenes-dioicae]|uniref:BQ5605_C008g04972 protein n=1 Tax=Microbotryum silenes-dioicae TaxID=796604 RepID=A0A2X0MF52_9BASI|nr:BQ5605_C008g04972 [Microbotryum silenes-dioicae]